MKLKKTQPSEHRIQVALVEFLHMALKPEVVWSAIPNGEKRHIRVAQRLKNEGVRRGTPDLFFCLPEGRVAWLEMKAAKGSLSEDQKIFRDRVQALGHRWALARSVDEAAIHLASWGVLKPSMGRFFQTNHLESIKLKPAKELTSGTQA